MVVEAPDLLIDEAADIVAEISGAGVEITMALPPATAGPTERLIGYLVGNGVTADEQEILLRGELAALAARRGLPGAVVVRCEPLLEED
ncbi:MAG: hypothetical protein Q8M03_08385, partial [Legionella sp.]|nr:hypothetical protein [Legionella sp.]